MSLLSVYSAQLAVLWCIAGVALICAINSRGFLRAVLSWLITIAIFVMSAIFSYINSVSAIKQEIGLEAPSNFPQAALTADSGMNAAEIQAPPPAATYASDSVSANYLAAEKQLLEYGITISDSVLAFPKWKDISAQGIEKREGFESKALSLRNKSMDIYRQIRKLSPPGERKEFYDLLLAAADNLRLAGYETHYQFGQEGDNANKAAVHAAQAKAAFLLLKEQL